MEPRTDLKATVEPNKHETTGLDQLVPPDRFEFLEGVRPLIRRGIEIGIKLAIFDKRQSTKIEAIFGNVSPAKFEWNKDSLLRRAEKLGVRIILNDHELDSYSRTRVLQHAEKQLDHIEIGTIIREIVNQVSPEKREELNRIVDKSKSYPINPREIAALFVNLSCELALVVDAPLRGVITRDEAERVSRKLDNPRSRISERNNIIDLLALPKLNFEPGDPIDWDRLA